MWSIRLCQCVKRVDKVWALYTVVIHIYSNSAMSDYALQPYVWVEKKDTKDTTERREALAEHSVERGSKKLEKRTGRGSKCERQRGKRKYNGRDTNKQRMQKIRETQTQEEKALEKLKLKKMVSY